MDFVHYASGQKFLSLKVNTAAMYEFAEESAITLLLSVKHDYLQVTTDRIFKKVNNNLSVLRLRLVNVDDYVPQFSVKCAILSRVAEFAHFRGISMFLRNFVEFDTGR